MMPFEAAVSDLLKFLTPIYRIANAIHIPLKNKPVQLLMQKCKRARF